MLQDIPEDYYLLLNQLVARGSFRDRQEALRHALDLLADEQEQGGAVTPIGDDLSPDEWSERFRQLVSRHRATGYPLDDSRESIYADRF